MAPAKSASAETSRANEPLRRETAALSPPVSEPPPPLVGTEDGALAGGIGVPRVLDDDRVVEGAEGAGAPGAEVAPPPGADVVGAGAAPLAGYKRVDA